MVGKMGGSEFWNWGHKYNLTYQQLVEKVTRPLNLEDYAKMTETPNNLVFKNAKKILFPKYGFCIELSGNM